MIVRAPASTANLGPSFDCAAAALDLWNELTLEGVADGYEVEIEGEGAGRAAARRDAPHLARVRTLRAGRRAPASRSSTASRSSAASARAPPRSRSGSSPAPRPRGREHTLGELLEAGAPLEGHSDNLAAALFGGVCVSWSRDGRVSAARIAADMPLEAVLTIPPERANTARSRAALPETVSHRDAAANAGSATMLGAAIAGADGALLRDAFDDRLHEPYRADTAPLLALVRDAELPGAVGATLSGSGPSVVVWAEKDSGERVAAELQRVLPDGTQVLPLRVVSKGASVQ